MVATDTNQPDVQDTLESRDAAPWLNLITQAENYFRPWQDHADNIDKLYGSLDQLSVDFSDREFQMFWANIEVLKPAVYARPPQPVVAPRYRRRDPLVRRAAEILERCAEADIERDQVDETLQLIRDDLLIPGRGSVWCRYHQDNGIEEVAAEYVNRRDFLHEPARVWREVGWVARRVWMTKDQLIARFPDVWQDISEEKDTANPESDDSSDQYHGEPRSGVWEIWHRRKRVVLWVTEGCELVLDMAEPHLRLEGFFPCPRPAFTTVERGTLKPIPDMVYYKDQLEEINELTARISALAEALKMTGFYPGGASEVSEIVELALSDMDNRAKLMPVSNFAALGGASLKDSIVWLPIGEISATITQLIALRRQIIDDVYQITGLSDIMRGDTVASETLGAQQLKAQYGSIRIRDRQAELVRFARDIIRMKSEIMAEMFQPQTLISMSQSHDLPTDDAIRQQMASLQQQATRVINDPQMQSQAAQNPQAAQQAVAQFQEQMQELQQTPTVERVMALLRAENVRPFTLEVETDSTIQPDEQAEKIRRTEFLQAVGGFIQMAGPMVQQMPQTAGFVAESLKFTAGGFRAGRQMDDAIDEFAETIREMASADRPDPGEEERKLQAAAEAKRAEMEERKLQFEQAKAAKDAEREDKRLALDARKVAIEAESRDEDRRADVDKEYLKAGFPPGYDQNAITDGVGEVMDIVATATSRMTEEVTRALETIQGLSQEVEAVMTAPRKVVRDERGRVVGVTIDADASRLPTEMRVNRGPDGRIEGVEAEE